MDIADIRELYQDVILDHNKSPRNFGKPQSHTHTSCGHNPLCGDTFELFCTVDGDVITDIRFEGSGCAISKASASMMTSELKGKTIDEARHLFATFTNAVTSPLDSPVDESLGNLVVLAGVREYPVRVKCATLAWHTMQSALNQSQTASTES